MHTQIKPYECTIKGCTKRFSRSDNLATHVKTHTTVKKVKVALKIDTGTLNVRTALQSSNFVAPSPGLYGSSAEARFLKHNELNFDSNMANTGSAHTPGLALWSAYSANPSFLETPTLSQTVDGAKPLKPTLDFESLFDFAAFESDL